MKILNPRGDTAEGAARILPSVRTLSGLRIAVLTDHWTSMDRMGERFRACAVERYGATVELFEIPINGAMAARWKSVCCASVMRRSSDSPTEARARRGVSTTQAG
jgi:hypothetical protein